MICKTLHTKN